MINLYVDPKNLSEDACNKFGLSRSNMKKKIFIPGYTGVSSYGVTGDENDNSDNENDNDEENDDDDEEDKSLDEESESGEN